MNKDMYSAMRAEHRRDLLAEVEQERLARRVRGQRQPLARRVAGQLGGAMITAGSRLKQIEQGGRRVAYDM